MSATTRVSWDIHHCPLAYKCRARWERLEPIQSDPTIRFCAACQRTVHLCRTDEDYTRHTTLGHCVALEVLDIGVAHVGQSLEGDPKYKLVADEDHPLPSNAIDKPEQ